MCHQARFSVVPRAFEWHDDGGKARTSRNMALPLSPRVKAHSANLFSVAASWPTASA